MPRLKPSAARVPLLAWRRSYGRTQAQVAEAVGIDQSQLSRQEKCGRVGLDLLIRYAGFYGVSTDELISGPPELES